jgi:hypothetical protein
MWKHLSILLTSSIQLTLGIALIACGIAYGYENYQGDKCSQAFDAVLASNQTRIKDVQARLDRNRVRDAALQARVAEIVRTFNWPAKDRK